MRDIDAEISQANAERVAAVADFTKACEELYARAARDSYADKPAVITAVAALKKAHAAFLAADSDLTNASVDSIAAAGVLSKFKVAFRGAGVSRRADSHYA